MISLTVQDTVGPFWIKVMAKSWPCHGRYIFKWLSYLIISGNLSPSHYASHYESQYACLYQVIIQVIMQVILQVIIQVVMQVIM